VKFACSKTQIPPGGKFADRKNMCIRLAAKQPKPLEEGKMRLPRQERRPDKWVVSEPEKIRISSSTRGGGPSWSRCRKGEGSRDRELKKKKVVGGVYF